MVTIWGTSNPQMVTIWGNLKAQDLGFEIYNLEF